MLAQPSSTFRNIIRLTEILLAHCEKHRIIIWPEYGSLLGWRRHQGVIPWDYDGDFGIFGTDKERLLSSFSLDHPVDLSVCSSNDPQKEEYYLDQDYYHDSGCLTLHFKDNRIDVIDIIFYQNGPDEVKSLQGDHILKDYPCPYRYCYPQAWFYPLSPQLLLGHRIYIPAQPETILNKVYDDWNEIPAEFKTYIEARFNLPPTTTICEIAVGNFEELIQVTSRSDQPLIVRANNSLIECSPKQFKTFLRAEPSLYGYSSSVDWSDGTLTGAQGWDDYVKGNLKLNVVDSPVTNQSWLNPVVQNYFKAKLGPKSQLGLTWILSNAPKTTHFHIDPDYAGGYMKLLVGQKIWWCLPEKDWTPLLEKGYSYESLRQLSLTQMLSLDGYALWGKIQVGVLNSGDLLWFPVKCLHHVITLEDSYGFGGYL